MAITKNPLIRYKILDQCFSNPGKKFFIEDLIEECNKVLFEIDEKYAGISRRQILADIAFMESLGGWSVSLNRYRVGKRVYYRYFDLSYSISNMPLNSLEINQLKSAIQILNQFSGIPQLVWIDEILTKLQQGINIDSKEAIIAFDSNRYLKGIENLSILFNAITHRIPLEVEYKDFKSDHAYTMVIHPYHLKQFNNRWFLFGFNPERENYHWNLAIDRIVSVNEKNIKFIDSKTVDWNEYFEDIIGVTKPNDASVEKVRLNFKDTTINYIINKPLHGSQKTKFLSDLLLQVDLEIIINYEFESLVLSFGNNVKVIEPIYLASRIRKKLLNTLEWYDDYQSK